MLPQRFHPAIHRWFAERFQQVTDPQRLGWPAIAEGHHTLIAAPTGSGKTLAAFLWAIDRLFQKGPDLAGETEVLYVSPLKALGNDIQANLQAPLAGIRQQDATLPPLEVLVRTGDTPASARAAMARKPPHILVTTPESLYILLGSEGGRGMLRTVRTVIVDEIHATAGSKRGSHLALSLERLEALAGPYQRVGLSATQKPIEDLARLLVGSGRDCHIVDVGHRRTLDLAVEVPPSPLSAVCSHEQWGEIYERMAALIREHRTTLVFVGTRKMAERLSARLGDVLGQDQVTCHHGSLARGARLQAEQRLRNGQLRALVATASMELGIDVGDVDLVIQVGSTRSVATALQRVGRSGHALGRIPKGRLFPLTLDELVEAAALLRMIGRGDLDRSLPTPGALDILAQQVVAACAVDDWNEAELFELCRRAWPYRDLTRGDFDGVVQLHAAGRRGLLHHDTVGHRLRGRRRARLVALTCGGAIPDTGDYRVLLEPEQTLVGTLNEDFAIESNVGDIFQLGNTSWRVLKIEPGIVRVADAAGQPPTIPFWLGEAPARTAELSAEVGVVRAAGGDADWLVRETGVDPEAARQIADYICEGRKALGVVPTQQRVVLERFFDESGGMQLIVHAPFGGRLNRAWGLALRKRFCRGFGFELQAAANEEAILISLGPHHSFPLADVFDFLNPATARDVLTQAVLGAPIFEARWRWNVSRSLLMERMQGGRRVPAPIQRMRADDLLAAAFPQVLACPENLPAGELPIPTDHPIVVQTITDCLSEALDCDALVAMLADLRSGRIERIAVDTPQPSAFARGILAAHPYSFLDDAPLEERRTQAVLARRGLDERTADTLGELDADAVRRVQEEAWPHPESADEVHEALQWMGYVTAEEAAPWQPWLDELVAAGRVLADNGRYRAVEASADPKDQLRGRLEALGPIFSDDPLLLQLEAEGCVLRTRLGGRPVWCERRLLSRIHRYTVERLRQEIQPVSAAEFLRFLACWQHVDEEYRLEGPRGVAEVVGQLAGFEVPCAAWERYVLPVRIRGYQPGWLDEIMLSGEAAWGRLWGGSSGAIRSTPIALMPRDDLETWLALAGPARGLQLSGDAQDLHRLLQQRGAMFNQELQRASGMLPAYVEIALAELIAGGLITSDSFGSLRQLIRPPHRRPRRIQTVGRWSLLRPMEAATPAGGDHAEFVARQLLRRTGVVMRRTLAREKLPVTWLQLVRVYRRLELRGELRGGRFVAGFSGEQFALPEAVELLRRVRRSGPRGPVEVAAADPLNLQGILTPEPRVPGNTRRLVRVG